MPKVEEIAKEIKTVLSLPVTVQEAVRKAADPDTNARDMADTISRDPVFAAKLLRSANSSFFGFVSKTSDINSAVVRLGLARVRDLALSLSLAKLFMDKEEKDGYSRLNVWTHSVAVGVMTELLAKMAENREAHQMMGTALLTGLVHDLGMILADQHMPHRFREIPPLAFCLEESVHVIERKQLGFTHADLGAAVLRRWRFPKPILEAVEGHHAPDKHTDDVLVQLVFLAECLVTMRQHGYCDLASIPQAEFGRAQQRAGLMGMAVEKALERFDAQVDDALEIFLMDS